MEERSHFLYVVHNHKSQFASSGFIICRHVCCLVSSHLCFRSGKSSPHKKPLNGVKKKEKKGRNLRAEESNLSPWSLPSLPCSYVDHPESSYSLYSAVQESEQLIRNLVENDPLGCSALQRGIRGVFALQMEALSLVWTPATAACSAARPLLLLLLLLLSSFAFVHSCISKQATCTVCMGNTVATAQPDPPVLDHAWPSRLWDCERGKKKWEPKRVWGARRLPLTR